MGPQGVSRGWLGTGIGMRPTLVVTGLRGALGVLCLLPSPIPGTKVVPESVNKS